MKVPALVKYAAVFFAVMELSGVNAFPTTPKSDGYDVSGMVNRMNDQVVELHGNVRRFDGGFRRATQINSGTKGITKSLHGAIDTTQACAKFNSDESNDVAMALLNFKPEVTTAMDVLISKEPVFRRGLFFGIIKLKKVVRKNLNIQKALATQFAREISQRMAPNFTYVGPGFDETINTDCARALEAFAED